MSFATSLILLPDILIWQASKHQRKFLFDKETWQDWIYSGTCFANQDLDKQH